MRRIADQHDVLVEPSFTKHAVELEPDGGAAKMPGIRDKSIAIKPLGKQFLAKRDRLFLFHFVDACGKPVLLRGLYDERGPFFIEPVGMQVEPTPLGLFEIESERLQLAAAAQPHIAVLAD